MTVGRCYECHRFSMRLSERRACPSCQRTDGLDNYGLLYCFKCDVRGGIEGMFDSCADRRCTSCGDWFYSPRRRELHDRD